MSERAPFMSPAPPTRTWRAAAAPAALAAAMLLAGCGSLIPTYRRPPAPIPAQLPGAAGEATVTPDWQAYYSDPRLRRLIALALDANRDLRLSVVAIEQARAQLGVRRADELPTVGVGAGATRQAAPAGRSTTVYSAGVTLSAFEIDLYGRLRSLSSAAEAQLAATAEARKAVQIGLIAAVASTYYQLQADAALIDVTRSALRTRDESLRLIRLRYDHGANSAFDLRQAESLSATARVALAQLTRQQAQDGNALALLLGAPAPADLPPALPLGAPGALAPLPVGLPSEVLLNRPDVQQAEAQLIAANANIGAARAAFFPRISLTGSFGSVSSELSGLFSAGSFAWGLAPQLLLPIFDAGRNRNNLALAQASRDAAVAQYEKSVQTAVREAADALAGRETLAEQLEAQRALAAAEASRFELADLRYRHGASSHLDVLDAQRALLGSQQAEVPTQAQVAQNAAQLYKVLGGGWADAPAATAAAAH